LTFIENNHQMLWGEQVLISKRVAQHMKQTGTGLSYQAPWSLRRVAVVIFGVSLAVWALALVAVIG
jgi:hypothetical protein